MSSPVSYTENGMNVHYLPSFFTKQEADDYFHQLKDLPFFTPTYKIRGRKAQPKRQMLAYGDSGTSYSFSGTEILGEPWSPLLSELRDHVEKHSGVTFNFVLLNKYANGHDYISQHKDNESCLDSTFPIIVLSFGAERTIEFKKPKQETISIRLAHGSLYRMEKPTNEQYTHGISVEPYVEGIRISLTFRHLLVSPMGLPLKKPRFQPETVPVLAEVTSSSSGEINASDDSSKNCFSESASPVELDDWLDKLFRENDSVPPVLLEFNLNSDTLLQVLLSKNLKLRISIGKRGRKPNGVILTPQTWAFFQESISKLMFHSSHESFISNNQLACICDSREYCILQQMFPLNSPGYFLKPTVLKLTDQEVSKLVDLSPAITQKLIEFQILRLIPSLIMQRKPNCVNHFNELNARIHFLDCLVSEIRSVSNELFQCVGCELNKNSQLHHDCILKPTGYKFFLNREKVLLNLNLKSIVQNLTSQCTCYFNVTFFTQFNLVFFESYLEENV